MKKPETKPSGGITSTASGDCGAAGGEPPYIVTTKIVEDRSYNPKFGDARVCKCGHAYYRHFDTYEEMRACGCKYCECYTFDEVTGEQPNNPIKTQDELLSTEYRDLFKTHHASRLSDAVYREGFDSEHNENPYVFDAKLDLARMKISLKKGPLTTNEKRRLVAMNAKMDATPWARWSSGHHARGYDFLPRNPISNPEK